MPPVRHALVERIAVNIAITRFVAQCSCSFTRTCPAPELGCVCEAKPVPSTPALADYLIKHMASRQQLLDAFVDGM